MKQLLSQLILVCFSLLFSKSILSQTVNTPKSVFSPGEKIVVNYSGFPGNAQDWIVVVPVSYRDDQLGQWFYTNGAQSGTMTFNALTDGEYEVRGYFNNQYVVKARHRFRVKKIEKQIHVFVRAADDNTAIPEVTVYAEGSTFKALYRATSEQSGIAVLNVETGGNFVVTVSHSKFISAKQNIKVDLYGDKSVYMLDFRLKRKIEAEKLSNTLFVYVTDANRKPIEGAAVAVMPGEGAVTNSSGFAKAIHRQHPGEYVVVLASANGYKDQKKRILVGTEQGNAITRPTDYVSFTLEKGDNDRRIFHLIVEVLDDASNEPVKEANVKLQISDGTDLSGSTNAKGEIKFTDMEYGYEGSGKVMVTHKDYNEKWSDVSQDLMTAKDMDERRFLVYVKKKAGTGNWTLVSATVNPPDPDKVWGNKTWTYSASSPSAKMDLGAFKANYSWTPPQQFTSNGFTISLNANVTAPSGQSTSGVIDVSGSGVTSDTETKSAYAEGKGSASASRAVNFKPVSNSSDIQIQVSLGWGSVVYTYKYKKM